VSVGKEREEETLLTSFEMVWGFLIMYAFPLFLSKRARSGHADLPSTAALLGGIAAQEAIKIVTRQYIPIDNTAVYDGIKQAMAVFRL
jgi:hypothetical protein